MLCTVSSKPDPAYRDISRRNWATVFPAALATMSRASRLWASMPASFSVRRVFI